MLPIKPNDKQKWRAPCLSKISSLNMLMFALIQSYAAKFECNVTPSLLSCFSFVPVPVELSWRKPRGKLIGQSITCDFVSKVEPIIIPIRG